MVDERHAVAAIVLASVILGVALFYLGGSAAPSCAP